jgi:hypothetical protein
LDVTRHKETQKGRTSTLEGAKAATEVTRSAAMESFMMTDIDE